MDYILLLDADMKLVYGDMNIEQFKKNMDKVRFLPISEDKIKIK